MKVSHTSHAHMPILLCCVFQHGVQNGVSSSSHLYRASLAPQLAYKCRRFTVLQLYALHSTARRWGGELLRRSV